MAVLRHMSWGATGLVVGGLVGLGINRMVQSTDVGEAPAARESGAVSSSEPSPRRGGATPEQVENRDLAEAEPRTPSTREPLAVVLAEIDALSAERTQLLSGEGVAPEGALFHPDQQRLEEWARCAVVPADIPSSFMSASKKHLFSEELVSDGVVTDAELSELEAATERFEASRRRRLAQIYADASGDESAMDLSTPELLRALRGMQRVVDPQGAQRRFVAEERAGTGHSQESDGDGSLVPYYREIGSLGDDLEKELASVVGDERASHLRVRMGGWGVHVRQESSCREPQ